jgi:GTPase
VTFLDLCGHEKYLKTTMFGLVGLMPDYCMVIVGANMGVSRMTKEHLGISIALKIPMFIVITKIDIAPKQVHDQTIETLVKIMKNPSVNKAPIVVKDTDDI